jgi:hypothetical protein
LIQTQFSEHSLAYYQIPTIKNTPAPYLRVLFPELWLNSNVKTEPNR